MSIASASGSGTPRSLLSVLREYWETLLEQREDQMFLVLALVIGALVGLTVVAFILLTERLGMRIYPVGSAAWRRVLMPIAGALTMGWMVSRYFPSVRGSDIPQTKAALFARDGYISLRAVIGKFLGTVGTLASGIPLGPEGPSVLVGAGIGSVLGRWLGLRPEKVKALIPVGVAAAIAAAFNTPMAAVLFALEEVMGDLHAPILGSVVLASATSWAVLQLFLGNNSLFHVPNYNLVDPIEFVFYAVLGAVGGVFSAAFSRSLLWLRGRFLALPQKNRWLYPLFGGVVVGLMGWAVPQVLGVGYNYIGLALNDKMTLELMAMLVVMKMIGVVTSSASGNSGGILGPILFMGAMLGGTVGSLFHLAWPHYTATPGAYALVGMGVLFAGIVRAPMTSVLMIFEMTRDYEVIVPLMIANMMALFIAGLLHKEPLYEGLAHQDGIHLPTERTRSEEEQLKVPDVMEQANELMQAAATVGEVVRQARISRQRSWPVMDGFRMVGLIQRAEIDAAMSTGLETAQLRELLPGDEFPHVHLDQTLTLVLERMRTAKVDMLPVVSRADIHLLEGVVTREAVLRRYGFEFSEATVQS